MFCVWFVLSVATKKEIVLDYSLFTFYIFGMVSDFSFIEGKGFFVCLSSVYEMRFSFVWKLIGDMIVRTCNMQCLGFLKINNILLV